jgi:hypothetical protein
VLGAVAADADIEDRHLGAPLLLEDILAAAAPAVGDRVADEQQIDLAFLGLEIFQEAFVTGEKALAIVTALLDVGAGAAGAAAFFGGSAVLVASAEKTGTVKIERDSTAAAAALPRRRIRSAFIRSSKRNTSRWMNRGEPARKEIRARAETVEKGEDS